MTQGIGHSDVAGVSLDSPRMSLSLLLLWSLVALSSPPTATCMRLEAFEPEEAALVKRVGDYFMAHEFTSVRLSCSVKQRFEIMSNESLDGVAIAHSSAWTFVEKNAEASAKASQKSSAALNETSTEDKDIYEKPLEVGEPTKCSLVQEYGQDANKGSKSVEVVCSGIHVLEHVTRREHEGSYRCTLSVRASISDRELVSAALDERLSLFVVVKDVASIVVTCIVLSVIGFIIVSAIFLRMAGHRFSWEPLDRTANANDDPDVMAFDHRPRSRLLSNASQASGIIFQADPEAMARLMERLDHVEDVISGENGEREVGARSERAVPDPPLVPLTSSVAAVSMPLPSISESPQSTVTCPSPIRTTASFGKKDDLLKKYAPIDEWKQRHPHAYRPKSSLRGRLRKNFTFSARDHRRSLTQSNPALPVYAGVAASSAQQQAPPSPHHTLSSSPPKTWNFAPVSSGSGSGGARPLKLKRRRSLLGIFPSGIGIGAGAAAASDDELVHDLVMLENERRGLFGDSPSTFRKISMGSGPPPNSVSASSAAASPGVRGSRSRQTSDAAPILEEKEAANGDDESNKETEDGNATENPVVNGSEAN